MLSPEGQSPDHPARQLQLESSHAPSPASSAPVRPPRPRPKTDSHRPRPLRSGRKNFPPNRRSAPPSRSTILITSTSPTARRQLSSTIRFAASTASRNRSQSTSPYPSARPSRPDPCQFSIPIVMEIMENLGNRKSFPRLAFPGCCHPSGRPSAKDLLGPCPRMRHVVCPLAGDSRRGLSLYRDPKWFVPS